MYCEGIEIEALAGGAQQLDFFRAEVTRAPHAGAGGEDLESVGTQLGGAKRGLLQRAGRESVNAEAQKNILAERRHWGYSERPKRTWRCSGRMRGGRPGDPSQQT